MTTAPPTPSATELEGIKTSLGGSTDKIAQLFEAGDRIVAVIEATVPKAGKVATKGGVEWQQTLSATEVYVLDPETGKRVAGSLRAARQLASNSSVGVEVLPGFGDLPDIGDELATDDSGVVLTPEEQKAEDIARDKFAEATAVDLMADEVEPWPGYVSLSIKAVKEWLEANAEDVDEQLLTDVEAFETTHKSRAGILAVVESKLAKLTLPIDDPPLPGEDGAPLDDDEAPDIDDFFSEDGDQ